MRIGVISDIHGNLAALEAALDDAKTQNLDEIVFLGDLAVGGPNPAECIRRVRDSGHPCIYGNTDVYLLDDLSDPHTPFEQELAHCRRQLSAEDLAFLRNLPFSHRIEDGGFSILFLHAHPKDVTKPVLPYDGVEALRDVLRGVQATHVVVGHTHLPFVVPVEEKLLLNPGSVARPRWNLPPSYAVIDTSAKSVSLRWLRAL